MVLSGMREGRHRGTKHSHAHLRVKPLRRGRFEFGLTCRALSISTDLVPDKRSEPATVKVYPNMRRAREAELKALGARSVVSSHRKTSWRGEGSRVRIDARLRSWR